MLRHALSQVPSGKGEEKNREAELHTLHIQTGGITVSMKEDNRGGEPKIPSPQGKKRAAFEDLERRLPNEGRNLHRGALPRRASLAHSANKGPAVN